MNKTEDELEDEQASLFKALGDPTRFKILSLLIEANGEIDVNGVVEYLDSHAQPTISHHLHLLIEAGLIERNRHGRYLFYRVKTARLEEAQEIIAQLLHKEKWVKASSGTPS